MSERTIDDELVAQVLKGDKEAFDVLVLKYQESVTRIITNIIHDPIIALDITQETFINAYRALPQFQGKSSFYTWIYRIAVNSSKNYLKMKGRRPPDTDIDVTDAIDSGKLKIKDFSTPETLVQTNEIQEAVINAVNTLPEELRTSIILREVAGLSYEEISKIMQCPVGTVRSRIFRARLAVDSQIKTLLSY